MDTTEDLLSNFLMKWRDGEDGPTQARINSELIAESNHEPELAHEILKRRNSSQLNDLDTDEIKELGAEDLEKDDLESKECEAVLSEAKLSALFLPDGDVRTYVYNISGLSEESVYDLIRVFYDREWSGDLDRADELAKEAWEEFKKAVK